MVLYTLVLHGAAYSSITWCCILLYYMVLHTLVLHGATLVGTSDHRYIHYTHGSLPTKTIHIKTGAGLMD
jgi:hypothetical protein